MSAPWTGGAAPGTDRPFVDGDYTTPAPVSPIRISFPFDHDSRAPSVDSFIYDPTIGFEGYFSFDPNPAQNNSRLESFFIEQDFEVAADYFEGTALDTPYDQISYAPDYSGSLLLSEAILIGESTPVSGGNGLVRWTRTYCRMPGLLDSYFSRNEYEQVPFTYPGLAATTVFQLNNQDVQQFLQMPPGGIVADGSPPYTTVSTARVQYDYFLAPDGSFSPNNSDPTLPTFNHLPFTVYGVAGTNISDFVADPEFYDEGVFSDLAGNPGVAPFTCTTPPKTDREEGLKGYLTAVANGWEICVRGSDIRLWRGNIWVRVTWFAAAL